MNNLWREWNPLWGMRWNSLRNGLYWFVKRPSVEEAWGIADGIVHVIDWQEGTSIGRVQQYVCDKYDKKIMESAGGGE
jgi:hypothetical protein